MNVNTNASSNLTRLRHILKIFGEEKTGMCEWRCGSQVWEWVKVSDAESNLKFELNVLSMPAKGRLVSERREDARPARSEDLVNISPPKCPVVEWNHGGKSASSRIKSGVRPYRPTWVPTPLARTNLSRDGSHDCRSRYIDVDELNPSTPGPKGPHERNRRRRKAGAHPRAICSSGACLTPLAPAWRASRRIVDSAEALQDAEHDILLGTRVLI